MASGGVLLSEDDANKDKYPDVVTSPSIFLPKETAHQKINVGNLLAKSTENSKENILRSHVSQKD
jgi:hypothetical protein